MAGQGCYHSIKKRVFLFSFSFLSYLPATLFRLKYPYSRFSYLSCILDFLIYFLYFHFCVFVSP